MAFHDWAAGNRHLQYKRDLIDNGFTVSDQLVSGQHEVLFDDIRRVIAFISPQFCCDWYYHDVRNVSYRVQAQLGNNVRYVLNMMTSSTQQPLGNIFVVTTNPSEPDYWVAKILAHCNQR
jgi:hypothetical protein